MNSLSAECLESRMSEELVDLLCESDGCSCKEQLKLKNAALDRSMSDVFGEVCEDSLGLHNMRYDLFL